MTMVMIASMAVVRERERGTLEQLVVTPINKTGLMLGKLIPFLAIGYVQMSVILLLGWVVFDVPLRGSVTALYVVTLAFIVANLALGLLVSTVVRTQTQAMQLSFLFLLPNILLSGFMFPREAMPGGGAMVRRPLPLTYYLRILRGILLRGRPDAAVVGEPPSRGLRACPGHPQRSTVLQDPSSDHTPACYTSRSLAPATGRPGGRLGREGTNFALSPSTPPPSSSVCLRGPDDTRETLRVPLRERTGVVWHAYLPEVQPGPAVRLSGARTLGAAGRSSLQPREAAARSLCPRHQRLDPMERALSGYVVGHPEQDLVPDPRDSAGGLPKCIVVESAFTWADDRPPRTPWSDTVLYECHVKGMTMRHPEVPGAAARHLSRAGGRLGAQSPPEARRDRGRAAPRMPLRDRAGLSDRGLVNYWGYNPIGFFAPDVRYATGRLGQQVTEFKTMVKRFHRFGLEVILDMVFNHTAEGNPRCHHLLPRRR